MPQTSRPLQTADWTDGSASKIAAPTPSQVASGFTAGQRPTYQLLNYLLWNLGTWVSWLDQQADQNYLSATIDPLMRLLGGGQWSWSASTGVLSWSQPFTLQVPGLADSANQMAAGSVILGAGQVAVFTANVPFTATGTVTSGSTQLTSLNFEVGIVAGQQVSGTGIPAGTTVVAVSGTTCTISQAATASGTGVSLTFVGSGTLTASTATAATLAPGPNTIVFARAVMPTCLVGVNASQFILRDQESKLLLEGGFTNVLTAPAGQGLTARQAVYISAGGADGRTAGSVYPADASASQGALRSAVVGVCTSGVTAGSNATVVSGGMLTGYTGLTPGASYYVDPANPGGITASRPAAVGSWAAPLGVALSASVLLLNPAGAQTNQIISSINPWPQYAVNSQSDLVSSCALTAAAGGGVIVVGSSFTLTTSITVPSGTILLGRKGATTLTLGAGGQLVMADASDVRDLWLTSATSSGALLTCSGSACTVRACRFILPAGSTGTGIQVTGNSNRFSVNQFMGVLNSQAAGITYASGTGNADTDSVFLS